MVDTKYLPLGGAYLHSGVLPPLLHHLVQEQLPPHQLHPLPDHGEGEAQGLQDQHPLTHSQ